jgi:hypothetical protein
MAYQLAWYSPGEVLRLDLLKRVPLDEMKLINQQLVDMLDTSDQKLLLVIDASMLTADYSTHEHLRATQLYRDHPNLDTIVGVAGNKLNRLIILLTFHLSRARFIQMDNTEQAQQYLTKTLPTLSGRDGGMAATTGI